MLATQLPISARPPHLAHRGASLRAFGGDDWDLWFGTPASVLQSFGEISDALAQGRARPTTGNTSALTPHGTPKFLTGILVTVDYELGRRLETDRELVPAADAGLRAEVHTAVLARHRPSDTSYSFARDEASLRRLRRDLDAARSTAASAAGPTSPHDLTSSRDRATYCAEVERIREAIIAGDVFQANLTRELRAEWPHADRDSVTGFAERLLAAAEPRYGAIIQQPTRTIISVSPERFFGVRPLPDGRLRVWADPIKGTRPRSRDPVEDARLAAELLASEKDRAENVMIADLVRNDLSRVCTDDSVAVERLCELASFARVHHLVTRVAGILRPDLSVVDALVAQFPCGSITGAPKWAAMDLLADLERRARGIYCGTIGFIDDRGHADFAVAIRTAEVEYHPAGATLRYGVGGGITTLSDPVDEWLETEDKARDLRAALDGPPAAGDSTR